nr:ribonuclease H-like domain, reverse transcriptase, RNA-dependent DNA polymerase [Tanacetum cinerariifolium]
MKAIRQVLRYIKGTKDYGITYKHKGGNKIHGYSDSSYGVNNQEGKGTTGIIFYYGESPISWNVYREHGFLMINYASGCIIKYDDKNPEGSVVGFKEEDTPNFMSFYSK